MSNASGIADEQRAAGAARLDPRFALLGATTAIIGWLTLAPLAFLFWQSFLTTATPGHPAQFTLGNFIDAYTDGDTLPLFANSLQFAIGVAVVALTLGSALAWINERTNTPLKSLIYALSVVPLVIPGILFVVAWIMLGSPKIGVINKVFQGLFNTDALLIDVYSMPGMIFVDGLHYSPIAFLLTTAAFRAMDPALEEAAMMSGASILGIARRVTLRLAWPAIAAAVLILFVRSLESFETPALLGLPVGIEVFTSAIYDAIHRYPSNIGLASAYAVTLLVLAVGGIWWQSRIAAHGARYSTVTGKGFRPRVMDIGRWRWATGGYFCLYATLVVVLPFFMLLWGSLQRFYSAPSWAALANVTPKAYGAVLSHPNVMTAIWNSAVLALGAASAVMLLTAVASWIVHRTKMPGRWLIDGAASTPLVLPGIVMGLAIMICYLALGGGIYGSIWIMFIAYMTRFMPYGMRYNSTSMIQLHHELEESAAMSGATWARAFGRIVLPLLKPGLIAGWIYIVIVSVRELSSSILLYSPGTEVVSVVIWELWQNGQYVELSALGVMLIAALFIFVLVAQALGRRFGVKEV